MIVITEEREEKKASFGPIKKISWPTNTKKKLQRFLLHP
jgi:hypothetical protein